MIDGIIKYNFDFKKTAPLRASRYVEIEERRERLFALGLIGIANGVGFGNISQRAGKKSFVITGTQTGHLKSLGAEHYSLIEDFNSRKFHLKASGAIEPSSEALTHGIIYKLSSKIGAVIHVHSKTIWNFMLKHNYLKTNVNVEYGSVEMIDEIRRIYLNLTPLSNSKFVMAGHQDGAIFFGKDLKDAEMELLRVIGKILK